MGFAFLEKIMASLGMLTKIIIEVVLDLGTCTYYTNASITR